MVTKYQPVHRKGITFFYKPSIREGRGNAQTPIVARVCRNAESRGRYVKVEVEPDTSRVFVDEIAVNPVIKVIGVRKPAEPKSINN